MAFAATALAVISGDYSLVLIRWVAIAFVAALSLNGCGDAGAAETTAEAATRQLHQMLDKERYAEIYGDADKELREAQTESAFISYLKGRKDAAGVGEDLSVVSRWHRLPC